MYKEAHLVRVTNFIYIQGFSKLDHLSLLGLSLISWVTVDPTDQIMTHVTYMELTDAKSGEWKLADS
jgi:hypothetical protein